MKISLKKVKFHHELSEETMAYSADLYIDGKLTAHASNHGHGGADLYQPVDREAQKRIDAAEAFFAQKTIEFHGHKMNSSLEIAVGDVLQDHEAATLIRRRMRNHVLFFDSDGHTLLECQAKPAERDRVVLSLWKSHPGCKVLNGMTTDQLVEAVGEAARKKEAAQQSEDDLSEPSKVDSAPSPG